MNAFLVLLAISVKTLTLHSVMDIILVIQKFVQGMAIVLATIHVIVTMDIVEISAKTQCLAMDLISTMLAFVLGMVFAVTQIIVLVFSDSVALNARTTIYYSHVLVLIQVAQRFVVEMVTAQKTTTVFVR